MLWVIIGLGNPEIQYQGTRHNLGFRVVDCAAGRWSLGSFKETMGSFVLETEFSLERVLLAKPQSYMNRSGMVTLQLRNHCSGDSPRIVVVYDDFNLPLGKIRLRERGSAGGHNGMESIIEALQTEEFLRLRVGIADENFEENAIDFVLSPFQGDSKALVDEMVERAVDALESLLTVGAEKTMTLFN